MDIAVAAKNSFRIHPPNTALLQAATLPKLPCGPTASNIGTYIKNVAVNENSILNITINPNLLKKVICAKNRMTAETNVVNAAEIIGKPRLATASCVLSWRELLRSFPSISFLRMPSSLTSLSA